MIGIFEQFFRFAFREKAARFHRALGDDFARSMRALGKSFALFFKCVIASFCKRNGRIRRIVDVHRMSDF